MKTRRQSPIQLRTERSMISLDKYVYRKNNLHTNIKKDNQSYNYYNYSRRILKRTNSRDKIQNPEVFFYPKEIFNKKQKKIQLKDFQKGKLLSEGKFGKVFSAMHKQTGFIVALKFMSKKVIIQQNYLEQLINQIKIQSRCDHKNIIKLYGFISDKQNIYLIQELGLQMNLYYKLSKNIYRIMTYDTIRVIIKQLVEGIIYLHKNNIIHGDIKPQNIIFSFGMLKICDFGWSSYYHPGINYFCGTLDYIAPQIIMGKSIHYKIDVWSIGILTYQLLFGKSPFSKQTQQKTFQTILNSINGIHFPYQINNVAKSFILKALNFNYHSRSTAHQLLEHQFLKINN